MGHMADRQGEVAAANLVAAIEDREPAAQYSHEMRLIIDERGGDSIYFHKTFGPTNRELSKKAIFWSWAKQVQQRYWGGAHS